MTRRARSKRFGVQLLRDRLDDDHIGITLVLQFVVNLERNEGLLVVGTLIHRVLNLDVEHADDFEALALHEDGLSDGGRPLEEALGSGVSEDHDATAIGEVGVFEVVPIFKIHEPAHFAIRRLDTASGERDDACTGLITEVAARLGADGANDGHFGTDGLHIFVFEVNGTTGALPSGLHAGLAGPDHDDVVTDVTDGADHAVAKSLSKREQKHNRNHAPRDAKHREGRAHAIAMQRRPTLQD